MVDEKFFDERTAASAIKAKIVSDYFWVWAQIITKKARQNAIGYVDLFAGPGVYGDGQKSTPILILEKAIRTRDIGDKLHVFLNDKSKESADALRQAVGALPGIESLKNKPEVHNSEVSDKAVEWLESKWPYPSLVFLDPWGYKGLTLRLIDAALKRKFSDVIFFFNFNRVNAAITNEFMEGHVQALLTPERLEELRLQVAGKAPEVREQLVMAALKEEVTKGGRHAVEFKFTPADIDKTSHYIILVTKDPTGLKPMKDIMARASTASVGGVASFSYAPRASKQLGLFEGNTPASLAGELLKRFAGSTRTLKELFYESHEGTKYTIKNYRDVVLQLEAEGKVICDPPAADRRQRRGATTLAEDVKVTFP